MNTKFAAIFLVLFWGLLASTNHVLAQCNFYSDYSSPNSWTQIGTEVEIFNGQVNFLNGAKCREFQKRLQAPLGKTLNEEDCWEVQFEFTPTDVGEKNNLPYSGHVLMGLTAGTNDVHFNCVDPSCTGHPPGFQDGIMIYFSAQNPPTGDLFFHIAVRDTGAEYQSQRIISLPLGTTHFVKLKKSEANKVELSVFSDSNFTNHLSGSPVNLIYTGKVSGLTHVQHGNTIRGELRRELTATLDNLCINWVEDFMANSSLPTDTVICTNDTLLLNAGRGSHFNYLWNTGSTDSVIFVDEPGLYVATISGGCATKTDTVLVHQINALTQQLADVTTCEGQPVSLTYSASYASFLWSTGEVSSTIKPTQSGLYSVEVTNDCETFYDEAYVTFNDCDCEMELPNVFTPNNDGNNDFFKPIRFNETCRVHLQVFNRWGSLVFETTQHQFSWDGKDVAAGTYFWVLTFTDLFGNEQSKNGNVTVIK